MASNPVPSPNPGDLIVVRPGDTHISEGLYIVTGGNASTGYTVMPSDNPRQNHAGTVAQARILAVIRAA